MPELHDHILSIDCYTARLMLRLCGVECSRRIVDFTPGATVPVYVDGGVRVNGAIPILRHLAGRNHPERWRSDDPAVERWLQFTTGPLRSLLRARDIRLFGADGDLDALDGAARLALRTIEDHLTEQHLADGDWFAGRAATLADIAVFGPAMLSHDAGFGHEDYPAINLWQRRVRALPGFLSMPGIPDYF